MSVWPVPLTAPSFALPPANRCLDTRQGQAGTSGLPSNVSRSGAGAATAPAATGPSAGMMQRRPRSASVLDAAPISPAACSLRPRARSGRGGIVGSPRRQPPERSRPPPPTPSTPAGPDGGGPRGRPPPAAEAARTAIRGRAKPSGADSRGSTRRRCPSTARLGTRRWSTSGVAAIAPGWMPSAVPSPRTAQGSAPSASPNIPQTASGSAPAGTLAPTTREGPGSRTVRARSWSSVRGRSPGATSAAGARDLAVGLGAGTGKERRVPRGVGARVERHGRADVAPQLGEARHPAPVDQVELMAWRGLLARGGAAPGDHRACDARIARGLPRRAEPAVHQHARAVSGIRVSRAGTAKASSQKTGPR